LQDNFTAAALFFLVIVGIGVLITVMHEKGIDDKYVTWFEGFVSGAFSTWTLSLKTTDNSPKAPTPPPDNGTRDVTTSVVTHQESDPKV
jgi:hypothetical protein